MIPYLRPVLWLCLTPSYRPWPTNWCQQQLAQSLLRLPKVMASLWATVQKKQITRYTIEQRRSTAQRTLGYRRAAKTSWRSLVTAGVKKSYPWSWGRRARNLDAKHGQGAFLAACPHEASIQPNTTRLPDRDTDLRRINSWKIKKQHC